MEHPVVLFDGVCNFCNGGVNFIIRQDKHEVFRFAPLQSLAGQNLLEAYGLPTKHFESFVLIEKGKTYQKSSAALKICGRLPWYWKWTQVFWILPTFLRNAVYHFISKNRYRWFGKKESCMIPTPAMKSRFLA